MQPQEAYFHIVRSFSSLENIARRVYGYTDSVSARDFEAHFERMGRVTRYLDRGAICSSASMAT